MPVVRKQCVGGVFKTPQFPGIWREGFNWDSSPCCIAGYPPPTRLVPDQESDLPAFAKKAGCKVVGVWWKETASGAKDERAECKIVLASAQEIDVILVTELPAGAIDARSVPHAVGPTDQPCRSSSDGPR